MFDRFFDLFRKKPSDEKLSGEDPLDAEGWFIRGGSLSKLGKYSGAIACYDRAIEINPRYAEALHNKGVTLVYEVEIEEAIECFDRAIEINPRSAETWVQKGVALVGLSRNEEALSCFEEAHRLGHDDAVFKIVVTKEKLGQSQQD